MVSMKISLLSVLALVGCANLTGQIYNKQNTYIDALQLMNIKIKGNDVFSTDYQLLQKDFYEILKRYGIDESNVDSNIFLRGLAITAKDAAVSNLTDDSYADAMVSYEYTSYLKDKLQPVTLSSSNWQAAAINGLSSYMAGRFKQESLHMAINQLIKRIQSDDTVIVRSIFPGTYRQIHLIDSSGSSSYYTSDLILLRQIAQIDLKELPRNLLINSTAPGIGSLPL